MANSITKINYILNWSYNVRTSTSLIGVPAGTVGLLSHVRRLLAHRLTVIVSPVRTTQPCAMSGMSFLQVCCRSHPWETSFEWSATAELLPNFNVFALVMPTVSWSARIDGASLVKSLFRFNGICHLVAFVTDDIIKRNAVTFKTPVRWSRWKKISLHVSFRVLKPFMGLMLNHFTVPFAFFASTSRWLFAAKSWVVECATWPFSDMEPHFWLSRDDSFWLTVNSCSVYGNEVAFLM